MPLIGIDDVSETPAFRFHRTCHVVAFLQCNSAVVGTMTNEKGPFDLAGLVKWRAGVRIFDDRQLVHPRGDN